MPTPKKTKKFMPGFTEARPLTIMFPNGTKRVYRSRYACEVDLGINSAKIQHFLRNEGKPIKVGPRKGWRFFDGVR